MVAKMDEDSVARSMIVFGKGKDVFNLGIVPYFEPRSIPKPSPQDEQEIARQHSPKDITLYFLSQHLGKIAFSVLGAGLLLGWGKAGTGAFFIPLLMMFGGGFLVMQWFMLWFNGDR